MRRIGRNGASGAGSQFATAAGSVGLAWLMVMVMPAVVVEHDAGRAVAERVAVDLVRDEVEVGDRVHRDRPERPDRRRRAEAQRVLVGAVELLALGVEVGDRVGRLVAVVAPQAGDGRDGPFGDAQLGVGDLPLGCVDGADLEEVEVVVEQVVGEVPAVQHRAAARVDQLIERRLALGVARLEHGLRLVVGVDERALTGEAERCERCLQLFVARRGRELPRIQPQLLVERERLAEPIGEVGQAGRGHERAPQRGERHRVLQGVHGGQVVDAVARPPPHDRGDAGRETDRRGIPDALALPVGREQQEIARIRARGALARVGEVVRPRVDELQHVVALGRVGNAEQHRPDAQVDLGDRVHGVVVDRDEGVVRAGQRTPVAEGIERCGIVRADARRHEPPDLIEVEHDREPVHVRVRRQLHQSRINHDLPHQVSLRSLGLPRVRLHAP